MKRHTVVLMILSLLIQAQGNYLVVGKATTNSNQSVASRPIYDEHSCIVTLRNSLDLFELQRRYTEIDIATSNPVIRTARERLNIRARGTWALAGSVYRLSLAKDANVIDVITKLNHDPDILEARRTIMVYTDAIGRPTKITHGLHTATDPPQDPDAPNDPLWPDQWGPQKAQLQKVLKTDRPTPLDIVAFDIDSGIDQNHPDLQGHLWQNPGEIEGDGIDNDGNGFIDDIHGANMVDRNVDLTDHIDHGTATASIIAATIDDDIGMAGMVDVQFGVVKIFDEDGATEDVCANAIYYVADIVHRYHLRAIINASWGSVRPSSLIHEAITAADREHILFVTSAGNNSFDLAGGGAYPALDSNKNVLPVAASTPDDRRAYFSNYGLPIKVAAPGLSILVALPDGQYGYWSGTSFSAPHVTGQAIRMLVHGWSYLEVKGRLMATGDILQGFGASDMICARLNVPRAMTDQVNLSLMAAISSAGGYMGLPTDFDLSGCYSQDGQTVECTLDYGDRQADIFELHNDDQMHRQHTYLHDGDYIVTLYMHTASDFVSTSIRVHINDLILITHGIVYRDDHEMRVRAKSSDPEAKLSVLYFPDLIAEREPDGSWLLHGRLKPDRWIPGTIIVTSNKGDKALYQLKIRNHHRHAMTY